jgi:hypothetical protein
MVVIELQFKKYDNSNLIFHNMEILTFKLDVYQSNEHVSNSLSLKMLYSPQKNSKLDM